MTDVRGAERLGGEDARRIWRGIVLGAFRVVRLAGSRERGSVVLCRVPPGEEAPLSLRERRAVALAANGESNKAIGFALGIAPSTAAGVLDAAARKLGVRCRRELIELFGAAAAASDPEGTRRGANRRPP